jgi:hypothetical protein
MSDQSAMLLTDQEWEDLADIAARFLRATEWREERGPEPAERREVYVALDRRRDIARRVVEAAREDD